MTQKVIEIALDIFRHPPKVRKKNICQTLVSTRFFVSLTRRYCKSSSTPHPHDDTPTTTAFDCTRPPARHFDVASVQHAQLVLQLAAEGQASGKQAHSSRMGTTCVVDEKRHFMSTHDHHHHDYHNSSSSNINSNSKGDHIPRSNGS